MMEKDNIEKIFEKEPKKIKLAIETYFDIFQTDNLTDLEFKIQTLERLGFASYFSIDQLLSKYASLDISDPYVNYSGLKP